MRTVVVVAMLVAACGRGRFDPLRDAAGGDGDGGGDDAADADAASDAPADAATVCGNAVCEGTLGETCGRCAADCNTTMLVCGNGVCDSGETPASCETDCGPSPWPDPAEEMSFLSQLSSLRTAGFMCPGTSTVVTAPALSVAADPTEVARHTAWHIAHQPWNPSSGTLCNGTTYVQILNATGFKGAVLTNAGPTAADVLANFKTDNGTCTRMMTASYTQASVGGITDGTFSYGWAVYFK